jgi:hypothetical protein
MKKTVKMNLTREEIAPKAAAAVRAVRTGLRAGFNPQPDPPGHSGDRTVG